MLQSPKTACQQESAAMAAVSALSTRGPKSISVKLGFLFNSSSSLEENPPSGPIKIAAELILFFILTSLNVLFIGDPPPVSSQ